MNEVVILCRRAIDWKRFRFPADAQTHFNAAHPVRDLVTRWNAVAGNPPFHEYRHFLHALAKETWAKTGARVVMNWIEPHGDNGIQPHVLDACKDAEWIIPIDDDDWLAPFICSTLLRLDAEDSYFAATWPSMVVHVDGSNLLQEKTRSYLQETRRDITLSCSYALSRRAIKELSREELAEALSLHGTASMLFQKKPVMVSTDIGAVHLRHRAAAGAASNPSKALNLQVLPFDASKLDYPKTGEWTRKYFEKLNLKHTSYGLPTPARI